MERKAFQKPQLKCSRGTLANSLVGTQNTKLKFMINLFRAEYLEAMNIKNLLENEVKKILFSISN